MAGRLLPSCRYGAFTKADHLDRAFEHGVAVGTQGFNGLLDRDVRDDTDSVEGRAIGEAVFDGSDDDRHAVAEEVPVGLATQEPTKRVMMRAHGKAVTGRA
jgi:hypothetical protein